jgi:hypothetical protein
MAVNEDPTNGGLKVTLKVYFEEKLGTLKTYCDARFDAANLAVAAALAAAKEAVAAAFESSKEAIAKAEAAAERRFESVNEFRGQLKDQQATFLPRSEAESRFNQHRDLIDAQAKQIAELQRGESRGEGSKLTQQNTRLQTNWLLGLIVMGGLNLLGLLATLAYFILGKH